MSRTVSVVMYHYVRDLARTRFPEIRGRTVDEFRSQIDYLGKVGNFISSRQLIDAVVHGADLPENAIMVSFDDGYLDHYTNVLPILHERKIEGMFFPPIEPIIKGQVLDTNKIHFILAVEPNTSKIINQINAWVLENQNVYGLPSPEELWKQFAITPRYGTVETRFIKLVLQRGLPQAARNKLVSSLFAKYVTQDESAFSAELYLNPEQIQTMHRCGQHFGSHGYTHEWFDLLSPDQQEFEIRESIQFLKNLGAAEDEWIMSYPYGCSPYKALTDHLRSSLNKYGCSLAFTDNGGKANLDEDDKFMLKRIDTNEVPLK